MEQFPDENWLDIGRMNLIAPIMLDRLDLMKTKGCDAVEWDNDDLVLNNLRIHTHDRLYSDRCGDCQ